MNIGSFNAAIGTMNLQSQSAKSPNQSTTSGFFTIGHYNEALGDIKTTEQDIKDFQTIADKTTDPTEKERYTQAVKDSKELLGKLNNTFQKVISSLNLDPALANSGKEITPQAYDAYVANGYKVNSEVLSGMNSVKINRFHHKLLGNENETGFSTVG